MVLADTLGPIAEVVTFFKEVRDSHFSSLTVSVNRNQHIGQMGSVRPSEPRRSAGRLSLSDTGTVHFINVSLRQATSMDRSSAASLAVYSLWR